MIRDKEMDEISWRYCSYWAQGIIWAFDNLTDNQFKSIVPSLDINKKAEKYIHEQNVKKYKFIDGVDWAWHIMFETYCMRSGYKAQEIKAALINRALNIYKFSDSKELIYKDPHNYYKLFGTNRLGGDCVGC